MLVHTLCTLLLASSFAPAVLGAATPPRDPAPPVEDFTPDDGRVNHLMERSEDHFLYGRAANGAVPPLVGSDKHDSTEYLLSPAEVQKYRKELDSSSLSFAPSAGCASQTLIIDVTFAVFYWQPASGYKGRQNGYITDAEIKVAMDQLNKHWLAASKITKTVKPLVKFNLKATRRFHHSSKSDWLAYSAMVGSQSEQNQRCEKLVNFVRGPYDTHPGVSKELFIYILSDMPGLNGFATLPQTVRDYGLKYDGVFMNQNYWSRYNDNALWNPSTLSHEVGHFLGLLHIFQGDCTNPGDTINDTPLWKNDNSNLNSMVCTYVDGTYTLNAAQKKQTSQYPSVYKVPNSQLSDACGLGQTLWNVKKAIGNILSYSYPLCRNTFTNDQYYRMVSSAVNIRKMTYTCNAS